MPASPRLSPVAFVWWPWENGLSDWRKHSLNTFCLSTMKVPAPMPWARASAAAAVISSNPWAAINKLGPTVWIITTKHSTIRNSKNSPKR